MQWIQKCLKIKKERGVKNSLYINSKCILTYPKPNVHVMPRRNFSNPRGMRWSLEFTFPEIIFFVGGDRYVLAYICAKNLNLIIWHLLHMCYPNKNRFILIFSLLTYCANLCLQFANLCLQFRVIIFRQIFDSALPWAVCCAGVLFI